MPSNYHLKTQRPTFYTMFLSYLYTIEYPLQTLSGKKRKLKPSCAKSFFRGRKSTNLFISVSQNPQTNLRKQLRNYFHPEATRFPSEILHRDAIDRARKIRSCKSRLKAPIVVGGSGFGGPPRIRMHRGGLDVGRFARIVTQITMIRVLVSRPTKRLGARKGDG